MKMDLRARFVLLLKLVFVCELCSSQESARNSSGLQRDQMIYIGKYENITWPDRALTSKIAGSLVLGGLMMVHERSDKLICGPIMAQGGVQALEMALFTIDWVNQNDVIPGISLGAHIKDDCDRDTYGLEQSVDFIKGYIADLGASSECAGSEEQLETYKHIIGVVGASSSVTSIQVANLLKLFQIPQVSFFSTSKELSDKDRYPYFARTIPSDDYQALVMVEIVKTFKWQYVSLLYEESSYGEKAMRSLLEHLNNAGICIAENQVLIKDSGVAGTKKYDYLIKRLSKQESARGVIVFGSDQEVAELMEAVGRANMTGHFVWIGSDGWGGRELVWKGRELEVEGAVTVQPLAMPIPGFDDYFLNLRPETNTRNPWFIEYWEAYFSCKYPNTSYNPLNENFDTMCHEGLTQTRDNGYIPEAQLQFVSDAVLTFAYAIKSMRASMCGDKWDAHDGLCAAMRPVSGKTLLDYLKSVHFKGLSGQDFKFDEKMDGPARYRILNFQQVRKGSWQWKEVGYFTDRVLKLNESTLQYRLKEPAFPVSYCSLPCQQGTAMKYTSSANKCCWTCVTCGEWQYTSSATNCRDCPAGMRPNTDKTDCVEIPPVYISQAHPLAIAALVFASLGIITTVFVIVVFVMYRDTPVVRASGRELSFVLLGGILSCYGMTLLITNKPNDYICGAQKFGIGFCFSIVYSAILTKTNRIARIFRAGKRTVRRPRFISPLSQLIICGALVLLQVVISIAWIWYNPPKAGPHFPSREQHLLVCQSAVGAEYIIGFVFPIILILICTFYACLTRKIPEAFNESQFIGFTMYSTCIIWFFFVPIYFVTGNKLDVRMGTLCFSISLSATVSLLCLFTPKLYIILLRPERNVSRNGVTSAVEALTQSEFRLQ